MSESTKPTSNEAENGNKSKPLLGDDFVLKTKFNKNDRVFHALFGWCKIRMISEKSSVIDCEAKKITYYIIGKGLKHYERDENGCQIVCVPVEELFSTKEEVPKIYGLQATAMSLKLTYDE